MHIAYHFKQFPRHQIKITYCSESGVLRHYLAAFTFSIRLKEVFTLYIWRLQYLEKCSGFLKLSLHLNEHFIKRQMTSNLYCGYKMAKVKSAKTSPST